MHPVARVSINIYRNLRTQQMSVLSLLCTFYTTCFGPYWWPYWRNGSVDIYGNCLRIPYSCFHPCTKHVSFTSSPGRLGVSCFVETVSFLWSCRCVPVFVWVVCTQYFPHFSLSFWENFESCYFIFCSQCITDVSTYLLELKSSFLGMLRHIVC
jgi:hypothetical protein